MRVLQVIGTRPNLTKLVNITGRDIYVYTGQHYSPNLICSNIPKGTVNIAETKLGGMITEITKIVVKEKPNIIVVYGDTRSALAGTLVANDLGIDLAHIESGCRCNDINRPEEKIRRMIDQSAKYLFAVNEENAKNLYDERVMGDIIVVGDTLYDNFLKNRKHSGFIISTIHREEHINTKKKLQANINLLKSKDKVLFILHPHTKKNIEKFKIRIPRNVRTLEPLGHTELMGKLKMAKMVITDSGGLIRESQFAGVPLVVIGKTEWKVNNYGDGTAEKKIKEILLK